MRILIISRYPPFPGGRENFVFELVNELSKKDQVLIITPDLEDCSVGNLLIRKYTKSKVELQKIINEFKPDIINSHTFYLSDDAISISKNLNIPFAVTLHGDQFAIGDKQRQDIVSSIVRSSDFVINVSENGKNSILKNVKNIPEEKLNVINNGVNLKRFKKAGTSEKLLHRDELGISNDSVVFLIPTRMASYKGLDFLIDTLVENKGVLKEKNSLFLISIPDYPFSEDERVLFEIMNERVSVTGIQSLVKFVFLKYQEIERAYAAADYFLLPSMNEQLPISILESMACEIPIIATKVGGIPELLTDQWDSLLVDFNDRATLFRSIMTLINKEKGPGLSSKAFGKVAREYPIEKVANKYRDLYLRYENRAN